MKKTVFLSIILSLVMLACQQINQMANFLKCEFRIGSVQNTRLAGINVQQIQSFSDLNLLDAARLTSAYAQGSLPITLTLNVDAKNPNSSTAAMNKMDWILLVEGKELVTGIMNEKVTLNPDGGTSTIPLSISADLKKIMSGNSTQENINLGLGLVGGGSKPSQKLTLKIRPSIMIGNINVPYPGYISVGTNFGAAKLIF